MLLKLKSIRIEHTVSLACIKMLLQSFFFITNVFFRSYGAFSINSTPITNGTTTLDTSYSTTEKINLNAVTNATTNPDQTACGENKWQCANGNCISQYEKCDGALQCSDGSDETLDVCKNVVRPIFGLLMYCTVQGKDSYPGVCPDVCHKQPEYCYYALLSMNEEKGTCRLPSFPANGDYTIKKPTVTPVARSGPADFSISYACNSGKALVGENIVECINGSWTKTFPECVDACKLPINPIYSYTCKRDGKNSICGEYVPIETTVEVSKKLDSKHTEIGGVLYTLCQKDRAFNLSSKCINAIERRQEKFQTEALNAMSTYETKFEMLQQGSYDFEELVRHFQEFELNVNGNSTEIEREVEACEISLDLVERIQADRTISWENRTSDVKVNQERHSSVFIQTLDP